MDLPSCAFMELSHSFSQLSDNIYTSIYLYSDWFGSLLLSFFHFNEGKHLIIIVNKLILAVMRFLISYSISYNVAYVIVRQTHQSGWRKAWNLYNLISCKVKWPFTITFNGKQWKYKEWIKCLLVFYDIKQFVEVCAVL